MRQIKIGPLLRNERDKRTYGEVLRRRTRSDWFNWLKSKYLPSVLEDEVTSGSYVVRYSGMRRQFHDIPGSGKEIKHGLIALSRVSPPKERYDIALHVRLGDFAPAVEGASQQNSQIPLAWYHEALMHVQSLNGGRPPKGILFSDEDPQWVIEKLGLRNFKPEPPGNALASILLMAQARTLIASRSTFSLWGQYLGDSCAIWPRGFDLGQYKRVQPDKDFFV